MANQPNATVAVPVELGTVVSTLQSLFGPSTTRQTETAVVSQRLAAFLPILATGRVMSYVIPLLVNFLVLPLLGILKTVGKALLLMGIMGWLMGALLPGLIGYLGIAGAGAFVSRAMDTSSMPLAQYLSQVDARAAAERGLRYLNLDSQECRQMMSCKAGEFLSENYPSITQLLTRSGIAAFLDNQVRSSRVDNMTILALDALQGRMSCDRELPPCASFRSLEGALDQTRIVNATRHLLTPVTTTTTPQPLLGVGSDMVFNAIKKLGYYAYQQ